MKSLTTRRRVHIMMQRYTSILAALLAANLAAQRADAVIVASDVASNSPYNDGWQVSDNGGTGFAAWSTINNQSGSGSGGGFIGNNNVESQINTSGRVFGVFGHSGGVGQAIRSFSAPLNVGEALTIDMDNGSVNPGGTVGFGLRNSSGNNLAEFFFVGGNSNYTFNASGVNLTSGSDQGFTNQGLRLKLTLTSATTLTLQIDRLINGSIDAVYTGNLFNPAGGQAIAQLRLFNANAGEPNGNNLFFNNFLVSVVPEASALWLGAVVCAAVGSVLCYRRLRRQHIISTPADLA
jgi:hypothetical protein